MPALKSPKPIYLLDEKKYAVTLGDWWWSDSLVRWTIHKSDAARFNTERDAHNLAALLHRYNILSSPD